MTRWLDRADAWCERHRAVLAATAVAVILAAVIIGGHVRPGG